MTNHRKAKPKAVLGPDYVLRCVSLSSCAASIEAGKLYAGLNEYGAATWTTYEAVASWLRGPGLASAVRALARRGYVVEKVPA